MIFTKVSSASPAGKRQAFDRFFAKIASCHSILESLVVSIKYDVFM